MKIIIEAEPKEITALVLEVQKQQSTTISFSSPCSIDCNCDDLIVKNGKFSKG